MYSESNSIFWDFSLRLSHDLKQPVCNFAAEILEKGFLRVKLYLQLSRDAKRYRAQQRVEKRRDIGTEAARLAV